MKILFFAGSLRTGSLNKKFALEAKRLVDAKSGYETEFLDLKDYPMPVYDQDIQDKGFPEAVIKLGEKIAGIDALVVSTPEYNGSIPSVLKNVIDWLSREKRVSIGDKPLLLISASMGALGGVRGLWQTRVPFEACGVHVFPTMMGLPAAHNAFDEKGELKEEKLKQQLQKLLDHFLKHIAK
ncbi:MAG: NADPH-dependent FMN reductase [Rickettsiales bacterium]